MNEIHRIMCYILMMAQYSALGIALLCAILVGGYTIGVLAHIIAVSPLDPRAELLQVGLYAFGAAVALHFITPREFSFFTHYVFDRQSERDQDP